MIVARMPSGELARESWPWSPRLTHKVMERLAAAADLVSAQLPLLGGRPAIHFAAIAKGHHDVQPVVVLLVLDSSVRKPLLKLP